MPHDIRRYMSLVLLMEAMTEFDPDTETMTITFDPATVTQDEIRRVPDEIKRIDQVGRYISTYMVNGQRFDSYKPAMQHIITLLTPRMEAYKQRQEAKETAWQRAYPELIPYVDLVPTRWLADLRGNALRNDVTDLMADIKENGVRSPVHIIVGQKDRYARIGEGNHRIEAALRLKLKSLPAMVFVYQNAQNRGIGQYSHWVDSDLLIPVEGYVPAEMKPSKVFRSLQA